ncbi:PAS domain-containing protein, partial [candidate division KSB1 bacterium]|nr:PAS domain-containing protein [candidate division KSB1 bacterium]NIS23770.1 PAS domain-containing protein [candidate division KSB1 bacterium]NIT70688.1 PAS domain-containing protein [candidate division KSB1 bacterium]NIU24420.1 PAS domain-containing protein [candidate division KSB1 bacterium]NIU94291.1 PAS domain-containing protein [candidate division KSB1 bacterium]
MNIKNLQQPFPLFKSVLVSTSEAVFIVDTDGWILYVNRAECDFL